MSTPIYDQVRQGLARKNDRITSVLAAESITDALSTRDQVLDILRLHGALPDEHIHRIYSRRVDAGIAPRRLSPQRIRTVRAQLVDDGLVEATDNLVKLPGARCASTIWKATDD